jgi:HSP20 family protein
MLSQYDVHSPLSPLRGVPINPWLATVNRLFEDFETAFQRPVPAADQRRARGPRAHLHDSGDAVTLVADLPGLRPEDIALTIEGGVVTLKATPVPRPVPEGFTPLRRERQPVAVEWSFALPYPIDEAAASALLEQGRLSVTLPKAPEAKPRNIPVKTS